ncbi:MAG: hypothetical protein ISS15_15200 [Alphaproteobacteria bacterium]|nr:hypothetical protein [Alphaproteobacteria bacterium]MBL7099004.1 hypothetical protein [Alphaproteobacteria bacterium]
MTALLALGASAMVMRAVAGPLSSVAMDPQSTVLHDEQQVTVPAGGAVGADLYLTARAFLSVDFDVQPNKQLSLLIIDASQKGQLTSGTPFVGRPLIRSAIDGMASVEIGAQPGSYYCAFLNDDDSPTSVDYRVSARPY